MDKQGIWVLTGQEGFIGLFASKELAIASLSVSYSERAHKIEQVEVGAGVLGFTVQCADAEAEERFALSEQEVHTVISQL